jgi:hypothetical protein
VLTLWLAGHWREMEVASAAEQSGRMQKSWRTGQRAIEAQSCNKVLHICNKTRWQIGAYNLIYYGANCMSLNQIRRNGSKRISEWKMPYDVDHIILLFVSGK